MNRTIRAAIATAFLAICSNCLTAAAQIRDQQVRQDREQMLADDFWIYDDLQLGLQTAKAENKPLMITLRCIP